MSTGLNATVTTTKEVKLDARLRKKLLAKLSAYASLVEQRKMLEHAIKKASDEIGTLRDETGEMSVKLEGYTITLVAGTRKKFNQRKFVSNGGDIAIYNQSFDEVPTKAFNKISLPTGDDESEEE